MTESPFATIGRIISEPSNAFDDLRIIAGGPARLDTPAREIIRSAADELEATQRAYRATLEQLVETQRRLIAVNDQLIAHNWMRLSKWQMSSGWIKVEAPK